MIPSRKLSLLTFQQKLADEKKKPVGIATKLIRSEPPPLVIEGLTKANRFRLICSAGAVLEVIEDNNEHDPKLLEMWSDYLKNLLLTAAIVSQSSDEPPIQESGESFD